jgi:membrane dipeptidase
MAATGTATPDRRSVLGLLAGAAAAGAAGPGVAAAAFGEADYARAIVIDGQGGAGDLSDVAAAMKALKSSGVTAVSTTVGTVGNAPGRLDTVVSDIANGNAFIDAHPDALMRVESAADLRLAKSSGRLGFIYNTQDTVALEGDVTRIETLRGLGVRVIQLTYNKRGLAGDGCLEPGNAGISDFGRQVVAAVNDQRIVLDLAHGGERTIAEAAAASKAPPLISHAGCRALVDNPRNVSDAAMRGVAVKGGVVGIYVMSYLRSGIGQPVLDVRREDLIAHLEHALTVCGEDHVGIGTDGSVLPLVLDERTRGWLKKHYDDRVTAGVVTPGDGPEITNTIPEYNSARRFLTLGEDLSRRGWPTTRIEKVIGGNFARVFTEVWSA